MDLNALKREQDELLKFIANTDPAEPEYGTAVANLNVLESMLIADENATFEREFQIMQHKSKVEDERRKFDLDRQIKVEQINLEKEEKKRRFDLDKTEKNRRFETEKRLTDTEISAKMAEIELSKRKFEFDMQDRTRRIEAEIEDNLRRIELEKEKLELEKEVRVKDLELKAAMNLVAIAEKQAQIEQLKSKGSNIAVPILEKVLPAALGLVGAVATINAEETRILTSKGLSVFKSIKS